jgi:hypothetical protein
MDVIDPRAVVHTPDLVDIPSLDQLVEEGIASPATVRNPGEACILPRMLMPPFVLTIGPIENVPRARVPVRVPRCPSLAASARVQRGLRGHRCR